MFRVTITISVVLCMVIICGLMQPSKEDLLNIEDLFVVLPDAIVKEMICYNYSLEDLFISSSNVVEYPSVPQDVASIQEDLGIKNAECAARINYLVKYKHPSKEHMLEEYEKSRKGKKSQYQYAHLDNDIDKLVAVGKEASAYAYLGSGIKQNFDVIKHTMISEGVYEGTIDGKTVYVLFMSDDAVVATHEKELVDVMKSKMAGQIGSMYDNDVYREIYSYLSDDVYYTIIGNSTCYNMYLNEYSEHNERIIIDILYNIDTFHIGSEYYRMKRTFICVEDDGVIDRYYKMIGHAYTSSGIKHGDISEKAKKVYSEQQGKWKHIRLDNGFVFELDRTNEMLRELKEVRKIEERRRKNEKK